MEKRARIALHQAHARQRELAAAAAAAEWMRQRQAASAAASVAEQVRLEEAAAAAAAVERAHQAKSDLAAPARSAPAEEETPWTLWAPSSPATHWRLPTWLRAQCDVSEKE